MKQVRRRTTAAALAIFIALATLAAASLVMLTRPAASVGFPDTPPWAAAQINWLEANGIAEGYPDGTFGPNLNITRAQAAYWFGNYNRRTSIVKGEDVNPSSSTAFQATTTCPGGRRAIGGGGQTSSSNLFITDSYPSTATAWTVRWESDNDASVDPSFIRVWVLCMPVDP